MISNNNFININSVLHYFMIWEIVFFSTCIWITQIRNRAVFIWVFGNAVGIAGHLLLTQSISNFEGIINHLGESLLFLSVSFKVLSFADRGFTLKYNRVPGIFLIIGVILTVVCFFFEVENFRPFLSSISGIFLSISATFYLLRNKTWVGLRPLKYCFVLLGLTVAVLIFLLLKSYPIGSQTRLIPVDGTVGYTILIVGLISYAFHMAFIGLIIRRQARENTFRVRKSIRIQQAINQSKSNEKLSAALAEERYQLLKMLTHEVRQPLNTAQATLDTVSHQLRQERTEPGRIEQTVMKAQTTLNSIVLSISNSILGATLITQGRRSQLQSIDLCDVSQLALSDLEPLQRSRIHQKFEQPVIYTDADPIILRLAIRNLLENALKYSPSGRPILFELVTDEEKLALVIRVTNTLNDQSTLNADIFERNKRGVDRLYEGTGLGLYIVRVVAELHKGDISYHLVNGNQVSFELTMPAY